MGKPKPTPIITKRPEISPYDYQVGKYFLLYKPPDLYCSCGELYLSAGVLFPCQHVRQLQDALARGEVT